jgi:5-methylcytosine-specific restriction endonuclease McrA
MRRWRAANPEKAKAANARSRQALRDKDPTYHTRYKLDRKRRLTAEWKKRLGGVCVKCGTTERLEFDHIDPTSKIEEPYKVLMQWPEDRIASELSKCQLLCRSCHSKKSHEDWGHNVVW